jgi:PAS domain S-box-containing protein
LTSLAVFAVLVVLSGAVWRAAVQDQRELVSTHTNDICLQASQRLELFVDSRLSFETLFAHRWATHETQDFSEIRFREFASLLIEELPGYHAVAMVGTDLQDPWVVPSSNDSLPYFLQQGGRGLVEEAAVADEPVLSAPSRDEGREVGFFAVVPLIRDADLLGFLLVEFSAHGLIDECFHQRIRSEFDFALHDGKTPLFVYTPGSSEVALAANPLLRQRTFPVNNRQWTLSVAPRAKRVGASSWLSFAEIPLLGLVLSAGLALLVFLLIGRMRAFEQARDQALTELHERQRAERALVASRARYKGVFRAATDGLLVLEQDGTVLEANPALHEMYGVGEVELIGREARALIAASHQQAFDGFIRRLETGGVAKLEAVGVRHDGTTLVVEVHGVRFTHQGRPALLAIFDDVTDRHRVMRQRAMLSRKILMAQEDERARVSRELHDGLGQSLTALRLELDWLRGRIDAGRETDASSLGSVIEMLEGSAHELRGICRGLRPPLLDDLGIGPAIRQLARDFEEHLDVRVEVDQTVDEREPVPSEVALAIYRVLQEALTNVLRHARARRATVSLMREAGALVLLVVDDGQGFSEDQLSGTEGLGIAGMRERAELVHGTLEIHSAPRQGTRMMLSIPVESTHSEGET